MNAMAGVMLVAIWAFWDLARRYLASRRALTVEESLARFTERQDALTKTFLASIVELINLGNAEREKMREKYVAAGVRAKV